MPRASPSLYSYSLRLPLAAVSLVACLLTFVLAHDEPVAAQAAAITVSPSSLSIPVGSRACYLLAPSTAPTARLTIPANTSPTVQNNFDFLEIEQVTEPGLGKWENGLNFCLKGKVETDAAITITHTISSTDTSYNGISVPSVTVTVTAADTTPTIRFLHSEIRVREGSTFNVRGEKPVIHNVHDLGIKRLTVKLDIAPAPTTDGKIIWHLPNPDCHRGQASGHGSNYTCLQGYAPNGRTANWGTDWAAEGLYARHMKFTSGSNDMEFTFDIRKDNRVEQDEWLEVFLWNREFKPNLGWVFQENSGICVGACSNPTRAQKSVKIWIMDDDGPNCNGCATLAEPGKIPAPDSVETEQPADEEESGKQIKGKSSDSAPNAPPTVANELVDVTLVNETAARDVSLAGVFEDADGDGLTVSVASSDQTVATASVVPGNKVTVGAKSRGTVKITVTADDGKGGTVSESFNVTVKSAPRVAAGLDESFALEIGVPVVLTMSDWFIDGDGDALSVTAGSSDDDTATATISSDRSTLIVSGVSAGDATIRVIAQDPDNNQAVYSFDVSVTAVPQVVVLIPPPEKESQPQKQSSTQKTKPEPEKPSLQIVVNTAPDVQSKLADVSGLVEGTSRDVSLSGAFADVDGDALTITASSDYTNVAMVSVASDSSTLTLTGVSSGVAIITVVAQDKDGNQASQTFNVEVTDAAPQQQPQTVTVVQQPTAVPAKDTQDTETEEAEKQETETQDTETEETDTFDALARYDTNGDGNIDKSELNQAADDYFEKKIITYSEFVEVYLAHLASSS